MNIEKKNIKEVYAGPYFREKLTPDEMDALKLPIDAREKIRSELSRIKSDEIKG